MKTQLSTQSCYWSQISTACGTFTILATEVGICWLGTPASPLENGMNWVRRHLAIDKFIEGDEIAPLHQALQELRRYFAGERMHFSVPLDLHGTPFQVQVWRELGCIPYGETRSYGEIAAAIGRPTACRAVGAANGANPLPVILPCHRVIGSSGRLTGYGGGLPVKEWLLTLEKVPFQSSSTQLAAT